MTNIILLFSILLNTLGLTSSAQNFDRNLISKQFGATNQVEAAENLSLPEIRSYPLVSRSAINPKIYAANYSITDSESGVVLNSLGDNEQVPIASTTKITTAVLVLENYNLDDVVTVSKESVRLVAQAGATPDFWAGETMTVGDLLKCMLIKSSNVAAYNLAEHLNPVGDTGMVLFVDKMNEKAKELGMNNTHYEDSAGLNSDGYSTAHDLTVITTYALKNPIFAEIVKTKETTVYDISHHYPHPLPNSNRLVNEWNYPGAIGVKTGFMPDDPLTHGAGHCLVAAVRRDGHTLISVVLKTDSNTPEASALESRKLQDWAWANTTW